MRQVVRNATFATAVLALLLLPSVLAADSVTLSLSNRRTGEWFLRREPSGEEAERIRRSTDEELGDGHGTVTEEEAGDAGSFLGSFLAGQTDTRLDVEDATALALVILGAAGLWRARRHA